MSSHSGVEYRPDIDGLRAIAVVAVVLFHAKVPLVSGGYVGVDVFFVISGFLIASILSSDIANGRFSIFSFYERRIRRIFPALFLVLFVVTIAAALLLAPLDLVDYSRSAVATEFSVSNILFWHQAGYFDASAHSKPLLHTWSLAVEEQFYVVFPLILFAASKWRIRHVAWVAPALISSFVLSAWLIRVDPTSAFYLSPARAWELLLGVGLALGVVPSPRNQISRDAASVLGFGLVLGSIFIFDAATPFPGLNAGFPCVGSAMLIWSGMNGRSLIGKALSWRAVVFVGLISYSLYLWHWPALVLLQYYRVFDLQPVDTAAAIALSFALAVASWRWVEQPLRRSRASRTRVFQGAAVTMSVLAVTALALVWSKGWESRYPHELEARYEEAKRIAPGRACTASMGRWRNPKDACVFGASGVAPAWALWGDSHAGALVDELGAEMGRHGLSLQLFSYAACPPVSGVRQLRPVGNLCFEYNQQAIKAILTNPSIENVVLFARYAAYIYGNTTDFGPAENADHNFITDEAGTIGDAEGRKRLLADRLVKTVALLEKAGKRVYLLYPVPEAGYDIPSTLLRLEAKGMSADSFARPYSYYLARNGFIVRALDGIEGPLVKHLRIIEMFCNSSSCRVADEHGRSLYRDDDHLSVLGARFLVKQAFSAELATNAVVPALPTSAAGRR